MTTSLEPSPEFDTADMDIQLVVAWPVWAGGYPTPQEALEIVYPGGEPSLVGSALESKIREFAKSILGDNSLVRSFNCAVQYYTPIEGLTPNVSPQNSLLLKIVFHAPKLALRKLRLQSLVDIVHQFFLQEMPGARSGANIYRVTIPRKRHIVRRKKAMPSGDRRFLEQASREDHHGQWACFSLDGHPAIQAFFPFDMTSEDEEFSVFWLGRSKLNDLRKFIEGVTYPDNYQIQASLIGPYGESSLLLKKEEGGGEIIPEQSGFYAISSAGNALFSATIVRIPGPSFPSLSLYLWADIANEPASESAIDPDDFREVGVKLTVSDWRDDRLLSTLDTFIRTTSSRGLNDEKFDFWAFSKDVASLAASCIESRSLVR